MRNHESGQRDFVSPRRYGWIGLDDASRLDLADLRFGESSLTARGTSLTSAYAAAWTLDVGPGWITRRLTVAVAADTWRRSLELIRDEHGEWVAHTVASAGGPPIPSVPARTLAVTIAADRVERLTLALSAAGGVPNR